MAYEISRVACLISVPAGLILICLSETIAAASSFQRAQIDADPAQNPWVKVVGDLDQDGRPDLIIDAGDVDNDGLSDIALASMHQGSSPQEVAVYLNSNKGRNWEKQLLCRKRSHDIILVEVNGDGRLDLFGANHGGSYQPVELCLRQ